MKTFCTIILFIFCFCVFGFAQESGRGGGISVGQENKQVLASNDMPVRVFSRVPAKYTDEAKENYVEGDVTLRVIFLASGKIGAVSVVSGLAYGLTEQAIAAAKQIQFEPAKRNGKPINVVKLVKFHFSIVVKEDDKDIKSKAIILEKPKPEYPAGEKFEQIGGVVKLKILLMSSGEVRIESVTSELPKEFNDKAVEAAKKLRFEPAIYTNNAKASVEREIEYEFEPGN